MWEIDVAMGIRNKINRIIEPHRNSLASRIYDWVMLLVICVSIVPLMFRTENVMFAIMDQVCCAVFISDYLLRWLTADFRTKRKGITAFFFYPFTKWAIVDLLSILPTFSILAPSFKLFRIARLLRILRVVKFLRYYEPLQIMLSVVRKEAKTLLTVLVMALFYVFCTALLIYNVDNEPMINTFFDAIYWAACTLTTVGYGDVYPVTMTGRVISMISAVVGIALIALPSGIITSAYLDELRSRRS